MAAPGARSAYIRLCSVQTGIGSCDKVVLKVQRGPSGRSSPVNCYSLYVIFRYACTAQMAEICAWKTAVTVITMLTKMAFTCCTVDGSVQSAACRLVRLMLAAVAASFDCPIC